MRRAAALVTACAALACAAPAAASTFADVGCLQDPSVTIAPNCTSHAGLDTVTAIGVSGDGKYVYTGTATGQITVFGRDAFGALTQVQCLSADGSSGACTAVPNLPLASITDVEVDGANVYVGTHDGAISAFARDAQTGMLSSLGCVAGPGTGVPQCTQAQRTSGQGAIQSSWVAPAPGVLYAGGEGKNGVSITMYDRDSAGALSQAPSGASDTTYCVSDSGGSDQGGSSCEYVLWAIDTFSFALNGSGTRAYATQTDNEAVIAFDRSAGGRALSNPTCVTDAPTTSDCPTKGATGIQDPTDVVVSPSTGDVYVSSPSSSTVAAFRPDLTEIGCIAGTGTPNAGGACTSQATGISGANALALSPDGKHLYVAGTAGSSVAELTVGADGGLSQPTKSCVSSALGSGCAASTALDMGSAGISQWDITDALAVSRPNTAFQVANPTLYAAAPGSSALHRFSLTAPATITLPTKTVPCTSASCQFILKCTQAHNCLVATTITATGIKPRTLAAKTKPVVVAAGSFKVPKGKTKTLHARTTKAGRRLLKASRAKHRRKLAAKLTVKVKGEPGATVFRVTLRP